MFNLILGENKDFSSEGSERSLTEIPSKNKKVRTFTECVRKVKTVVNFDFEFEQNEKRRREEYEDIQIYLNKDVSYMIKNEDEVENIDYIEGVNYGIINPNKLDARQRTSCNVWLAILDNNIESITTKKINLAYFEDPKAEVRKYMNFNVF